MQTLNYRYTTDAELKAYIEGNLNRNECEILIQVFSGELNQLKVKALLSILCAELPNAKVIGCSTSGEVIDGEMYDETIVISFSTFYHTKITSHYVASTNCNAGKAFAEEYIHTDTKAIICFGDGLKADPSLWIKGVYEIAPKTIVAGGNAGDNAAFKNVFMIHQDKIYESGMTVCVLSSEQLMVNNKYALNWLPIGKEMVVTKSHHNTVYEINNIPVLDIYTYYFGKDITLNMPFTLNEFPLLKVDNNVDIGRSVIAVNEDNSFIFAGHLNEGDRVRFAVGNVEAAKANAFDLQAEVNLQPSESIFTYSCLARKFFVGNPIKDEFLNLQDIAPTSGFFTFGEYYSTGKSNQVLSITTTVLSLSESEHKPLAKIQQNREELATQTRMQSLTCLVNVTQKELQEKIELLEYAKGKLIESEKLASLGELVAGVAHEVNTPVGVAMTGNSQICYEVAKIKCLYDNEELSEEALNQFIESTSKASDMVSNSLKNAVSLVNSFKSISVDQHSGESREFNLHSYINDIFTSLKSELKAKDVIVHNEISKSITLNDYPGVYAQIFSNLILNSIRHAFVSKGENVITIYCEQSSPLIVHYMDNGIGVCEENINKIFDPFFTTARGSGGSGLGLNVVYNLVTQRSAGSIDVVEGPQSGLHLSITL